MLGNEGEGLRWNLRSKAAVELSIAGSGNAQRGGVDSLNVSVAAGVLCQAFLSSVSNVRGKDRKTGRWDEEVRGGESETGRRGVEEAGEASDAYVKETREGDLF